MAKILTQITTAHEHYLTMQYSSAAAFGKYSTLSVTGAATLTSVVESPAITAGAGKVVLAVVSSITPITTAMTVTIGLIPAVIPKFAPLDSAWVFEATPGGARTVVAGAATIAGGVAGVLIEIWVVDDTSANWLPLGENFNEGVTFARGLIASPVARGWSATDHQKRVRSTNTWNIRQMYCSQMEGVANLRGLSIAIKDEVRTDGSATIKEVCYVMNAQVQNAAAEMGAGGGDLSADMVTASGYFSRMFCVTLDATALTATT